jgi:hypothetical protein
MLGREDEIDVLSARLFDGNPKDRPRATAAARGFHLTRLLPGGRVRYGRLMPDTAPDKHPGGRPPKLTAEFIAAAHDIIEAENNALIYTDEELLFSINEKLSPEARISKSTFEKWKAGAVENDVEGQEFLRLIAKAKLKQKKALFEKLENEEKGPWQRTAWIIERKFTEWNLKHNVGFSRTEDGAAALAAALLGQQNGPVDPAANPTATASDTGEDA